MYNEYSDYSFEHFWGTIAIVAIIMGIIWLASRGGLSVAPILTADPVKELRPFPKLPTPPGEMSLGKITQELSAIRELTEKISDFEFPDLVSPFERHINDEVNNYNKKVTKYVDDVHKCLGELSALLEEERARKSRW
jgi:hypothetical protein